MAPTFSDHLPLTDIDLEDTQWLLTYRPQLDLLRRSIAQIGVVTPVHLRALPGGKRLQVVCGFQRLHICREVGQTTVPALVHAAADLPDEHAFLLAVHENLGCRPLNAVETGRVLWRLRHEFGYQESTLLQTFCSLLGVPPRPDTLAMYEAFVVLDEPLQAATVAGQLAMSAALWIGAHAGVERQGLVRLFTELKLGSNRAREFIADIDDICRRDDCTASAVLQHIEVDGVLGDPKLSGPQKIERLRLHLRQARYPQLSAYEARFQAAVRQLRLPGQVRLRPPPSFEGSAYQVTFTFDNREVLQQVAQSLRDAASTQALAELLELL
jgi:hypothetical protein